jgi:hypothetical protein
VKKKRRGREKSVTSSKMRSKTPTLGRFNSANLVPVTDFRPGLTVLRQKLTIS